MKLPALWHPHAGANLAYHHWGCRNREILDAVRCHTLGRPGMGKLAQAVFVADYIEKGRRFPGFQKPERPPVLVWRKASKPRPPKLSPSYWRLNAKFIPGWSKPGMISRV